MTFSKVFLTSTTALGLSMAAAYADDNEAFLDQTGADNTALINQDLGADGSVGGGANQVATVDQDGDDNETDVLQQGDGNTATVTQVGDDNDTNVTQQGDGNRADNLSVGDSNTVTVSQEPETVIIPAVQIPNPLFPSVGPEFLVNTPETTQLLGGDDNESDVTIDGDDNTVDVTQIRDANDSNVEIEGNTNDVDVVQDDSAAGDGNTSTVVIDDRFNRGDDNIVSIDQDGDNESAVDIHGDDNIVGVTQTGLGNESDVDIEGDRNDVNVAQDTIALGNDSVVDVITGDDNQVDILQTGDNSSVLQILGNGNLFEADQDGVGNSSTAGILGSGNDAFIDQDGDNNSSGLQIGGVLPGGDDNFVTVDQASLALGNASGIVILGNANKVDVDQDGNNTASVRIDGSGLFLSFVSPGEGDTNSVTIDQIGQNTAAVGITGDTNDVSVTQSGFNSANVQLNGNFIGSLESDNNLLVIDQSGGALGQNTLTVSLWGDDNNSASAGNNGDGTFFGDAATVATLDGRLAPGTLTQDGSDNSILLNVGASGTESDDNLFSFLQDGNGNSITGTITSGFGNEVAVAQVGNGSSTTFSQIGSFNNLGVSQ
ncbi:beta strand repeat-containing protein [Roseovarius sp. SYSU LYC5161]|uniref:beta strand repeat-containing protein n=1 Tax=Roseovarius halophilus (ex Wu et al. 2025) TaxID=3376060 RepID=UPI003999E3C6